MELKFILDKLTNVENQENSIVENTSNIQPSNENYLSESAFTPDNPPWSSPIAFLTWLASIFFIAAIPSIGLLVYLAAKEVNLTDSEKLKEILFNDPYAIFINIVGVIPAHLATIALAWFVVTYRFKYSFREMLGWQWGGIRLYHLIGIVIGFFILAGVMSGFFPEQDNDLLRILRSSRNTVFAVAFMATFTAPLVEEVIYRGILYSAFQRTFGVPLAIFLVTLLFAAVHVPQYYPSFSTIFMILLLSLVLTLIRAKSNNLLPCIVLHTIFNGAQSALMIAQPYLEKYVSDENKPALFFWLN